MVFVRDEPFFTLAYASRNDGVVFQRLLSHLPPDPSGMRSYWLLISGVAALSLGRRQLPTEQDGYLSKMADLDWQ